MTALLAIVFLFTFPFMIRDATADTRADTHVIQITKDTFYETVNKHEIILISFYDPNDFIWLEQEWYGEAATLLAEEEPRLPVAQMDCKEFEEFCSSLDVTRYPQLRIYRDGKHFTYYRGFPVAGDIANFVKDLTKPGAKELKSMEAVEEFTSTRNYTVVGFFAEKTKLQEVYFKAGHLLKEHFVCGYIMDPAVLDKYRYRNDVVIFQPPHLHSKLEDTKIVYHGSGDYHEMRDWIRNNFAGLVGHVTMANYELFMTKRPMVTVYFNLDFELNPQNGKYYRNRIIKIAKQFRGANLTFGMASKSELDGLVYRRFGVKQEEVDFVVGIAGSTRKDDRPKYLMQTEFSIHNFGSFVKGFVDGTELPFVRKQPVPGVNDGSVKVVVVDNFDQILRDPSKDVLVNFYQDNCGKCRIFDPILGRIGDKLKNDPNIVIAKIDAVANDPPEDYDITVEDFPTVFWVPIGKKNNPQQFKGRLEVAPLMEFIKNHSTHPPVIDDDDQGVREEL